jgi:ATP-binding cassette, subfamily G (WHITE), member 2, SNQ2
MLHLEYTASWIKQTIVATKRTTAATWRDPTYVTTKPILNICGGLFIGFTSWKNPSTLQGIQIKLFSIFVILILSIPGAQQLQIPLIANRMIYGVR